MWDDGVRNGEGLKAIYEGISGGVFQNFNPLCGTNLIEMDLD